MKYPTRTGGELYRTPAAAVVDLDGTVVRGESVIDGAAAGIQLLREAGIHVVFLTNRTTESPATHAEILRRGGIDVDPDDICTAATIAADTLTANAEPSFVVGSTTLLQALRGADVRTTTDPDAAATVVAGVDPDLNFTTLTEASRALLAGARLVATNPDSVRPSPEGPIPETGAIVGALYAATGCSPTILGKPAPAAAQTAASKVGVDPAHCLYVGDNPSTDIELGRRVGGTTVLVREDVTVGEKKAVPDVHLDSLADIDRVLEAE